MFSHSSPHAPTGFAGSPFFYCGAPQDEALARLHFLVDERRACGLVIGGSGTGKSSVLGRFAQEVRRAGGDVVLVDMVGRDSRETLWAVANGLNARVGDRDTPFAMWRAIGDRLLENKLLNVRTAILCDHVDQAGADAIAILVRLLHGAEHGGPGATLLAATSADAAGQLPRALTERIDLRVELEAWTEEDIAGYLEARYKATGPHSPRVDRQAVHRLWELSQGLPRAAARLIDLALVASFGQRLSLVNPQTIEAVHRELSAVA